MVWVFGAPMSPLGATRGQAPTFRSGLTLVPLDVRVVDRRGASINDLTKDDFLVSEDGVLQDITHFERNVLTEDAPATPAVRSTMAPFAVESGKRRVFYIELDRLWLNGFRFGLPEALAKFLRQRLLPQDYAVVSSFGRMTDLTADHEALAQVVTRLAALHAEADRGRDRRDKAMALRGWRQQPASAPMRQALDAAFAPASASLHLALRPAAEFVALLNRFESDFLSANGRSQGSGNIGLGQSAALWRSDMLLLLGDLQYLRFIDGQKHLVFFPGDAVGAVETDRAIARIANDARVAIHNIRGTRGLPSDPGFGLLVGDMAAKNISGWTGGSTFLNRYPDEALDKIDDLTRGGYLLGYSPRKGAADERYRRITVRVKRPDGARVMVRDSYLSTNSPAVYESTTYLAKQQMLTVAEFPGGVDDIGVDVAASVDRSGNLTATVTIDVSRVSFATESGRRIARLELAVFCSDSKGQLAGQRWTTLDLKLQDNTMTKVLTEGLKQVVTVPVSAPVRVVKAVVFDHGSKRAGASTARVK